MSTLNLCKQVISGMRYDVLSSNQHELQLMRNKTPANKMPHIAAEFLSDNFFGDSLHLALALYWHLQEHNISSYLVSTIHRELYSVLYKSNDEYVFADIAEAVKTGKSGYLRIPMCTFMHEYGPIQLFEPYGENGDKLFFEDFLEHPAGILVEA